MNSHTNIHAKLVEMATAMTPGAYALAALQEIANQTECEKLTYWFASARFGMHFHHTINAPEEVANGISESWDSSPISLPILQRVGEFCGLTDLLPTSEIEQSEFITERFARYQMYIRGLIVFPNFAPGILDTLVVYDDHYGEFSLAQKDLFQECFMALRYGYMASVNQLLRSHDYANEANPCGLVDVRGYFYGSNSQLVRKLEQLNPDLIYTGTNALFDPPVLRVESQMFDRLIDRSEVSNGLFLVRAAQIDTHTDADDAKQRLIIAKLSPREIQVANAIALGHPYKSIADDLNVATSTVSNLAKRVKAKLGVNSRAEIIKIVRSAES